MANGALDHQKDLEKSCASVDGCRASESLCFAHMSIGDSPPPEGLGCKGTPNVRSNIHRLLETIESQARDLLRNKASVLRIKSFLREVPWHEIQQHVSSTRPITSTHAGSGDKPSAYVILGAFTYGGVVGVTNTTRRMPWMTRLLTKVVRLTSPGLRITSVCVSCNVQSPPHKDKWNLPHSNNVVIPLQQPTSGGELWIEPRGSHYRKPQKIVRCNGLDVVGCVHKVGQPVVFEPKQWHHTLPWTGDRIVLIGYSTYGYSRMRNPEIALLRKWGFPLPFRTKTSRQAVFTAEHQALTCQETDVPFGLRPEYLQDHGPRQSDQVRAPDEAHGVWRATTHRLDEGAAQVSPCGACGRASGDSPDDRAGRGQVDQQVQNQDGPPGTFGELRGGVHHPHEHGPAEEQDHAVPDGEQGSSQQERLHGIRQVRSLDIRRNGVCSELHQVVPGDSGRDLGVPLEAQEIHSLGQRCGPHGEGPERDLAPESRHDGDQSLRQDLCQPEDHDKLCGHGGILGHPPGGHGDDPSNKQYAPDFGEQSNPGLGGAGPTATGSHEAAESGEQPREPPKEEARGHHGQVRPSAEEGSLLESHEISYEQEGEFVHPGELCRLSLTVAKDISQKYEEALMSSVQGLGLSSTVLLEVGGSQGSVLGKEVERICGEGSVVQASFWNGGDLDTVEGRGYIKRLIKELSPRFVWIYGDSKAYSPLQKMNQRSPQQVVSLQAKREAADRGYEGVVDILRAARSHGATCVLEMAEACEAWNHSWYSSVEDECKLYKGICQGCQVNRRDFQGGLVCRGWGLASSDGALVQNLSLVCDGKHSKSRNPCYESKHSPEYPREFARRVSRYMERCLSWFETARQLQGPGETCLVTDSPESPEDMGPLPAGIQDIPAIERKRIFRHLHQIHTATGHCNIQYMKSHLKRRGAKADVLRCVDHFKCDVCAERSRPDPRSQSTLVEIAPKWHTLQCDAFSWNHPESGEKWQFMMGIDEGSRLRVGRLLFQHATKTPSAQDFTDYFEGHWLPNFGKPNILRLDPAGCFRSKGLDAYLADRSIEVSHIPAEAHWQISIIERAIQSIKAMMSALVSEDPSMSASEAFYRSVWASNHRDQHRGYSPLQHAFGRSPDELGHLGECKLREVPILTEHGVSAEFGHDIRAMCVAEKAFLDEQAKERLRRAELSGARAMKNFCPGDLVFAWRRMTPKQDGSRHFKGGKFVGPYRVLATETRVADDGTLRAGHVIWLYRGGQLVKAAPQQLRPATDREESWNELLGGTTIPWTISETLKKQPPHQYEDISSHASDMPPHAVQEEMESGREAVPRRISGKRSPADSQLQSDRGGTERESHRQRLQKMGPDGKTLGGRSRSPRPKEFRPVTESNEPHASGDPEESTDLFDVVFPDRSRSPQRSSAMAQQKALERADFLEDYCGVVFPEEECAFWSQEGAAVSFSVELPKIGTKQGKEWSRDLGCFFSKQLRRNAVEISERHLSPKELEGFRGAKQKEVKNFVVAKAFQKLPPHMKPSHSQVLKMRWILTWKLDDSPNTSPLKKDPSGNPLKPKARAVVLGYMDPQYEHRPTSSPTMSRTTRQMFLQKCADCKFTVEKGDISGAFLQGDDFGPDRPMVCEPLPEICEALGVPAGSQMLLTKAAYGLVEAPIQWFLSVSRFLEGLGGERQLSDPCCWGFFREDRSPIGWICGHVDDFLFGGQGPEWEVIKAKIKERFKWGQWESGRFLQCGVLIEQDEQGFKLSQPDYLDNINEIHVSRQRAQAPDSPINQQEMLQLRSVLGALSWHATQVAPQWSSSVSLLLQRRCTRHC